MFRRLKEKWKVGWWQFVLIFTTFALGGSACARAGSWLLGWVLPEKTTLYWIIYVPLVTVLWPFCVLMISIPLFQFRFFVNYLHRMWLKISGRVEGSPKRLAVFASGTGTNAAKLIEHFKNHLVAEVVLIVCNKPGAGVIQLAEKAGIPVLMIEKEPFFRGGGYAEELKKARVDYLILAGFLWKLPSVLIDTWPNRILNIHPALLPNYGGKGMYGEHVHKAVIASGDTESGITIHLVDEHYDHGDTLFKAKCPVFPEDTPETLASRIHELEHRHYPRIVEKYIAGQ